MAIETEKVIFNALEEGNLFKDEGLFYLKIKETWSVNFNGIVNALSLRTSEKVKIKGDSVVDRYPWKQVMKLL